MTKLFILFFLLLSSLNAKDESSCYTVQLISASATEKNKDYFSKQEFPSSCKLMQISQILTVRCGCYERFIDANAKLPQLQKNYKHALIATTFKYRFTDKTPAKSVVKKNTHKEVKHFTTKDEELKLMLQSFLYVNDLDNAYKTAQLGYKDNPNSYYWNQKMAEISRWSGRGDQAIKYMKFMYFKKHNEKLQNDIINYGLKSYQYEGIESFAVRNARKHPTEKNIDTMIFVQSQIGVPEKSAKFLEEEYKRTPHKRIFLRKALQLYLDMGDLDSAKRIVTKIEKISPYTTKEAELIAYYYYLKRDMQLAYNSLLLADTNTSDKKYYEQLSDLGWYLQKYKTASDASLKLYEMKSARLVDFERIAQMQKEENLPLVSLSSADAYRKYHSSYVFYSYANYALTSKHYDDLNKRVEEFDAQNSTIRNESQYWLIKAQLDTHYGNEELAIFALKRALTLEPNNMQTQLSILYFYIENNFIDELKVALDALAQNQNLNSNFYFPLASSYFYIQDINRASYFVDRAKEEHLDVTKSIDFKFLEAYIYQIRNNENAFILKMREIRQDLIAQSKLNPDLFTNDYFLNNYLNASMSILQADEFEAALKDAKPHLSKKNYDSLDYSWSVELAASEKSHEIYNKIEKKELWMQFSNALTQQNHSEIEDLLDAYLKLLPIGDSSRAANDDGQTSLAQTLAYKALNNNDDSQNAYIAHLNLVKQRSDLFSVKPSYYLREPLEQKYIELENRTYLDRNFYLYSKLNYATNKTTDDNVLLQVPEDSLEAGFALRKVFRRGFAELDIEYHDEMANYFSFMLSSEYSINHYYNVGFALAKDINADESTQLMLGGKKDMAEFKLLYNLLPSTSIEYLYQHNIYSSQDDVHLGAGDYNRIILSYQLKNAYPDMRIGTFIDSGIYSEVDGSKGVIDTLQNPNQAVLPEDFYNIGLNYSYGMVNSVIYTRVWRPYFEVSSYYNSFSEDVNYGLNAGYGGMVNGQDHLVFGANYTQSVNGIGGTIFKLFLKYEFLYAP